MALIIGDQPLPGITPVADSLDGTAAADSIAGLELNDTLNGLGGDDTLDGGNGNDTLDGGLDNDLLLGGPGNDLLIGGAGADALDGGLDADTADYSAGAAGVTVWLDGTPGIGGDAAGDVLTGVENIIGTNLNDTLFGDNGPNILQGLDGDDRLWGHGGPDTLDGGIGVDHAHYEDSPDGVQVDLNIAGPQISTGDASGDVLISIESVHGATNFSNVLVGTFATGEHLKGGNFADTITGNGGTGGDYIDAQGGDDILIFNTGDVVLGTTISGGSGNDTLVVQTDTDFTAAGAFLTGIEEVQIGPDQTATFGAPQIDGQSWNITGAPGSTETLQVNMAIPGSLDLSGLTFGPDWDDSPVPGDNDAVVVNGSAGADTVTGTAVADTLFGNAGADTLFGGFGDDVLDGGDGIDVLNGGDGFDTASFAGATGPVEVNLALQSTPDGDILISIENIAGATGFANTITGTGGGNALTGGDFDDVLTGAQANDTLIGGAGNDTLQGNTGDDVLMGGLGNDVLRGGDGADTLYGGQGDDSMLGGAGADTYVIEALSGKDVIGNFDKFDVVDVSALGLFFDVTDVQAASSNVRGGVLIDFGGGNSLTILGKTMATLDNGDFIF